MTTGLVLGKFAPLHKGHQHLIETAMSENERVVVLIYDSPEVTTIPLATRSGWLKSLYPDVEVVEAWDGPSEMGDTAVIKRIHDEFILNVLNGRKITHFYSSEFYGEHVSIALGAVDRRIDPQRKRYPISGTQIRGDAFKYRGFIDPLVYRDLITKVVLLGAPSTGKTTLARSLASEYETVWIPEYGREYWESHQRDRRLTLEQLVEIAEGHRSSEDSLFLEAREVAFIDTDATTTLVFSKYYHGKADPRLETLAADSQNRYDLFVLCGDEIPFEDTWDRSGPGGRSAFQERIKEDLKARETPYVEVKGSISKRIELVAKMLDGFDRFNSLDRNAATETISAK